MAEQSKTPTPKATPAAKDDTTKSDDVTTDDTSSTSSRVRRGSRNDLILDALLGDLAKDRGLSKEQYLARLVSDEEEDDDA